MTIPLDSNELVRLLQSVRRVAGEYGIPTAYLKPCIAVLLDGNIGGAGRHDAAFVIAVALRDLGWDEERVRRALERWARKTGYGAAGIRRALTSAFAPKASGQFKYPGPGLVKTAGRVYDRVLSGICQPIGCPQNCPPLAAAYRGIPSETYERFESLGWPRYLRRQRHVSADDVYRAVTLLERRFRVTPGGRIITSYGHIAELAGRDKSKIGNALRYLAELGLLSTLELGSGSGPHARDRVPTTIKRMVPIPAVPDPSLSSAITSGSPTPPNIGGRSPAEIP